jgi:predicted nucleic acid-binding protein
MPEVVVDSNVLFGAFNERDQYHDRALPLLRAFDREELPKAHVTTLVLPEVLNPIQQRQGHDFAVDVLDRLSQSVGFTIEHPTQEEVTRGEALFYDVSDIEYTDCVTVAYIRSHNFQYIYSFDDDFDAFDDLTRLNDVVNPFV